MITSCPPIIFLCFTAPVIMHFCLHSDIKAFHWIHETEALFFLFFSPAGKEKKGCSALPRMDQDTCLFPLDEKAVEYYFASDAR